MKNLYEFLAKIESLGLIKKGIKYDLTTVKEGESQIRVSVSPYLLNRRKIVFNYANKFDVKILFTYSNRGNRWFMICRENKTVTKSKVMRKLEWIACDFILSLRGEK